MEFVLEKFVSLLRFAIVLGILVFVHELGHFVAAKLVNVYVERFSVGFGWKLLGFKFRETEYWLSAIPWGGYVKMAGQEDLPGRRERADESEEEAEGRRWWTRWFGGVSERKEDDTVEETAFLPEQPEASDIPEHMRFYNKRVSQRMAVLMAGPLMNILLGPVVFTMMFSRGIEMPRWREDTRIGLVAENYPAAEAGLAGGDRILSIDGKRLRNWQDLQLAVWKNPGRLLEIVVERDGAERTVHVTPRVVEETGRAAIGVDPFVYAEVAGVVEGMSAQRQGLQAGDRVLAINGSEVSVSQMLKLVGENPDVPLGFSIGRDEQVIEVTMVPEKKTVLSDIAMFEGTVTFFSPDLQSLLRRGDQIVSVDSKPVHPGEVEDAIGTADSETVMLGIRRDAALFRKGRSFFLSARVEQRGFVGFTVGADSRTVLQKYDLLHSVKNGLVETWKTIELTFESIALLASRRVSAKEVIGPVGIFALTEQTSKMGFSHLLNFIGVITVNLALVNLLPIPVLDGGHVLFSGIEGIRRKPLDARYMEILHQLGFALILFLVLLVTYNDILRFFTD